MKKLHIPLLGFCLFAVVAFPINSCRKVDDLKCLLEDGRADLRQCSITRMTQAFPYYPYGMNLAFVYNSRKNPVSITPDIFNPYYSQWLFYYDKKGRLSQSVTLHYDGTFERWHVYLYDVRDRIIGDSTYATGQASDRGTAADRWLMKLYYDQLDRVIKETQGSNFSIEYTYNNQGNLTSRRTDDNGQISVENIGGYVNEASVLLTNRVWRFLTRDYSLNSRTQAYSLNEHKLPTEYRETGGHDIGTFFFGFYGDFQLLIQYDCQDAPDIAK